MTDSNPRQLLSMTQRRSSFSHEPPGFNRASRRLDQIAQAQAEALHVERIRQSSADMADLIEHARQGEFREADATS
jgi:hypothetical protein